MSAAAAPADRSSSLSPTFWLGQMDLRPIALFRIAFGLFIAYDLLDLLPNATTFFSDTGVMPRHALLQEMIRWNRVALSDLAGPPEAVYAYWAAAFVTCMFVVAGYHTRVAQLALYLFVAGFNERLPELFDGSDSVIRLTLFWLCFCPSGNRYSVDAILAENRGAPKAGTALALPMRLVQAQISWVYFCTFLHKTGGHTWADGSALHYVLHLNHVFARPWTAAIADYALPMAVGTIYAMVFEAAFLWLVFFPIPALRPWTKLAAILGGVALHGGIAATVNVGLFSYLMPVTYLALFEPAWTEWIVDRLRRLCGAGKTVVVYDGKSAVGARVAAALRQMDRFGNLELVDVHGELPKNLKDQKRGDLEAQLHAVRPDGAVVTGWTAWTRAFDRLPATFVLGRFLRLPLVYQLGNAIHGWASARMQQVAKNDAWSAELPRSARAPVPWLAERWRIAARDLGCLFLATLFVSAAWYASPQPGRRYLPLAAEQTVQWFSLWNVWDMFSPEPLRTDYHLRAIAEWSDGSTSDLFGGPADGPGEIRGFWFSRWWKYMENVTGGRAVMPREWGNWQCRNHSWNVTGGQRRLWQVTLKKENQIIPPIGQPWPPVQVDTVWNWQCYQKDKEKRAEPKADAPKPDAPKSEAPALVTPAK